MKTRLAVISLWAQDVPGTAHFYRDVIGLPLLSHHGGRPHFDLDGTFLTILSGKPALAPTSTRFPVVAFQVEDLDEAIQKLQAHQVELPWGIEQDAGLYGGTGSRWVMFNDPAGNLIELVAFGQPEK